MSLTKNNYYLKFSFISFFYFLIFILKRISSVPSCSPGINNCIKCKSGLSLIKNKDNIENC